MSRHKRHPEDAIMVIRKVLIFRETSLFVPVMLICNDVDYRYMWCHHLSSRNYDIAKSNALSLARRVGVVMEINT